MACTRLLFASLALTTVFVNGVAPSILCPSGCECKLKTLTATCGHKKHGLTFIPAVPAYVRHFTLQNGNIPVINSSVLAPISKHGLLSLTLETDNITYISEDAFGNFPELNSLDIRGNDIPVDVLKVAFRSLGHLVRNVVLRNMNIHPPIPLDLFQANSADNLTHLDLGDNSRIGAIPSFCWPNGSSIYSSLRYLNLVNTGIRSLNNRSFSCLNTIEHIDLSGNPIKILPNNTFNNLLCLKTLFLMDLRYLTTIEERAFKSKSIKKLKLAGFEKFQRAMFPGDFPFKWAPQLMQFQLSRTRIYLLENDLRSMLLQLKSITILNLNNIGRIELPSDTLGKLPHLEKLDLQGNYLPSWSERTFSNVTHLKYLNLDSCEISTINETSFPVEMRTSITHINLGNNPFFCTCDLLWFRTWMNEVIRNKSITFLNYPHRYDCKNLGRLRLDKYNPTHASCVVLSPFVISGIAISGFAVLLFVISLVVYRNRWNIRYCMYSRRRRQYQKLPGRDTELKFDAFVSCDSHDMDWMITEVCYFLENELGLKLCIHRRDFEGAKMIIDNIMDCMEQSRKIILIVSNDFARSHWCQCEVQLALDEHFRCHKEVVIVIREMVSKALIFKSLKALISSTTYVQWEDSDVAKNVFRYSLAEAMGCKVVNS